MWQAVNHALCKANIYEVLCPTLCLYGCLYGCILFVYYVCITWACIFVYMCYPLSERVHWYVVLLCYICYTELKKEEKKKKKKKKEKKNTAALYQHCSTVSTLQHCINTAALYQHCSTVSTLQHCINIAALYQHCSTVSTLQGYINIAISVCSIFLCPNNGVAANVWDFKSVHRCKQLHTVAVGMML